MRDFETITPPEVEPLTVEDAKLWARLDDSSSFDPLIPGMITSARQVAEQELGSRLITQTVRAELDAWPDYDQAFALHPVQSVALTYWDGTDWLALDAGEAIAVRDKFGVYVRRTQGGYYESLGAITHAIRQFIAAHIAFWVRNPESAHERQMIRSPFLAGLLDPYRTFL
jgi:hypothetical protein